MTTLVYEAKIKAEWMGTGLPDTVEEWDPINDAISDATAAIADFATTLIQSKYPQIKFFLDEDSI